MNELRKHLQRSKIWAISHADAVYYWVRERWKLCPIAHLQPCTVSVIPTEGKTPAYLVPCNVMVEPWRPGDGNQTPAQNIHSDVQTRLEKDVVPSVLKNSKVSLEIDERGLSKDEITTELAAFCFAAVKMQVKWNFSWKLINEEEYRSKQLCVLTRLW